VRNVTFERTSCVQMKQVCMILRYLSQLVYTLLQTRTDTEAEVRIASEVGASATAMTYRNSGAEPTDAAHRQRLLKHMATLSLSPASPRLGMSVWPVSPGRGSPVRPVSAQFDGRCTIASPQRLATPNRSRRIAFPTGTLPGKSNNGVILPERIALRELYMNPPKEPAYVNDSRRGSVRLAVYDTPGPASAPKRQEFARCAEARGLGGVFARSNAGCVPYCP